jgi:integrase
MDTHRGLPRFTIMAFDLGQCCRAESGAVADLLGHSSIAITGDAYGHTSDDTARAAVDGLAGRLGP